MNKKLFALLTSAALMAGFVPAVFAEEAADPTASVTIKPTTETVAPGEDVTYDVIFDASDAMCTVQFNFDIEGGEFVSFEFDDAVTNDLKLNNQGFNEKADKEKFPDNDDYQVVALDDVAVAGAKPAEGGTKIGTLTVKAGEEGNVTVGTLGNTGIANYDFGAATAVWTTNAGTVAIGAKEESSSEAPASSSEAPASSSEAPASSSEAAASSSSQAAASSSSQAAASSSSQANNNNANNNVNTGAASTAVVALAAASAALVVVSKKRK